MVTLKIDATSLVGQVLEDYCTWKDFQKFVHGARHLHIDTGAQGLPCFLWTDLKGINNCESPVIVIDAMTEGWHCAETFAQYSKNRHYVIFSSGWWDVDQNCLPVSYDLVYYPYWLMELVDVSLSPHRFCFHQNRLYNYGTKKLLFTCIVGGRRSERDKLIDLIQSNLSEMPHCLKYAGKWLTDVPVDTFDIMDTLRQYDSHAQLNPKYYYHNQHAFYTDLLDLSRFNLVVETNIDMNQHSWFLTEKTLKAMLCGCPFVIMATPWFLRRLRDMGFRTYGNIWNESYDDILDTDQRMCAIIDLCRELADLDWDHHREQLVAIRNHNFATLCNLGFASDQSFRHLELVMSKLAHVR